MAHLLIIGWILLGYLIAAIICICFRELLAAICDACFLEVKPPPEGEVSLQELKRLWGAPTDGASGIAWNSEGGWRLARSDAKRPAGG